jgi:hypothetical protein
MKYASLLMKNDSKLRFPRESSMLALFFCCLINYPPFSIAKSPYFSRLSVTNVWACFRPDPSSSPPSSRIFPPPRVFVELPGEQSHERAMRAAAQRPWQRKREQEESLTRNEAQESLTPDGADRAEWSEMQDEIECQPHGLFNVHTIACSHRCPLRLVNSITKLWISGIFYIYNAQRY